MKIQAKADFNVSGFPEFIEGEIYDVENRMGTELVARDLAFKCTEKQEEKASVKQKKA